MYWGYIIYSKSKDRFYVGTTGVGPQIRLDRHNDGWTRSTKAGIPWELKFIQTFDNKSEASKWERMVKKQKSRAYLEHLIHLDLNEFKKLPSVQPCQGCVVPQVREVSFLALNEGNQDYLVAFIVFDYKMTREG